MDERQTLFNFVAATKARYDVTLDQLRARCSNELRGMPNVELMHIYVGMTEVYAAQDFLDDVRQLEAMPARSGEHWAEEHQRRIDQVYSRILGKIQQFSSAAEMGAMRMQAWEAKPEFDAVSWQGEKPSEAVAGIAASIQTFFHEHPALKEQLQSFQNTQAR